MKTSYLQLTASGKFEPVTALPAEGLPIGCKIYAYGYGMSEAVGAITSAPNEHGTQTGVYIAGEAGFFSIDNHTRPHGKKFGIGHYYDDNLTLVDQLTINAAVAKAHKHEAEQKQAAEDKKKADEAEQKALPKKYPYLTVNPTDDKATTKKNIVAMLKHFWPKVKFSVRKRDYSAYYVTWTDGPADSEVDLQLSYFKDHTRDYTGDYNDYTPSNFNKVFGGIEYIFTTRELSEEVQALKPAFIEAYGEESHYGEAEQVFYRVCRKTSISAGAVPTALVMKENACGCVEDLYTFSYAENTATKHRDVANEPVFEKVETNPGEVVIVDYSEKAIAVIGDTKTIKDQLKDLGGRFNFRLSCGAGWIFPKTKLSDVQNLLSA